MQILPSDQSQFLPHAAFHPYFRPTGIAHLFGKEIGERTLAYMTEEYELRQENMSPPTAQTDEVAAASAQGQGFSFCHSAIVAPVAKHKRDDSLQCYIQNDSAPNRAWQFGCSETCTLLWWRVRLPAPCHLDHH